MRRIRALVTPRVLEWARNEAGFELDEAAGRSGYKARSIEAWEQGTSYPSVPQAKKLARLYARPLALFYLSQPPPSSFPKLPDFRRLPADEPPRIGPELRFVIRMTLRRQEWLREALIEDGREPVEWLGSRKREENASRLAETLRDWLGIGSIDDAPTKLRAWIDLVESKRAYVCQASGPNTRHTYSLVEARGVALADDYAPYIILNSSDADTARIFTLVHELLHLWVGEPGISNNEFSGKPVSSNQEVEIYCNKVTGLTLLPPSWLREMWRLRQAESDLSAHISGLAKRLGLSREVVARRASDDNLIRREQYSALRQQYLGEPRDERKGQGNYYYTAVNKAGRTFTQHVLQHYHQERISDRAVAELLDVKIDKLPGVAERVGMPS